MKRMAKPALCRLGLHRWRVRTHGRFDRWTFYRCERCWQERLRETPSEHRRSEQRAEALRDAITRPALTVAESETAITPVAPGRTIEPTSGTTIA